MLSDQKYITTARQTLAGWRRMSGPLGKTEDTLRMIRETIDRLESIKAERADESNTIGKLIEGYKELQAKVRAKAH